MDAMVMQHQLEHDGIAGALRLAAPRVVPIVHERRSLARRAVGRAGRAIRAARWRRRLAAFGPGSAIDPPAFVTGGTSISVGARVRIRGGSRLEAINARPGEVRLIIGDRTVIHPGVHIGAIDSVRIGRGVLMAADVFVTDHDHDWTNPEEPVISNRRALAAPVEIGDYAWLGERVMVLKGVTIGEGAVVGAGSIVTSDVPARSIAVGAPARIVKCFDDDTRHWRKVAA